MSKVVEIRDFQAQKKSVFFTKEEMNDLLALYGSRVATGDWCDYAIEQRNGIIAFSVFKNTYDAPEYTVAKCSRPPRGGAGQFLLLNGPEKLAQTDSLEEILTRFADDAKQANGVIQLVK